MNKRIAIKIILLFLIASTVSFHIAADEDITEPGKRIQYRILIRFKDHITTDNISLFFKRFDLRIVKQYSLKNLYLCEIPSDSLDAIDELCELLNKQPEVKYAEKDQKVSIYK